MAGEAAQMSMKGTPFFMAPEVIKQSHIGRQSDLYEILFQSLPFPLPPSRSPPLFSFSFSFSSSFSSLMLLQMVSRLLRRRDVHVEASLCQSVLQRCCSLLAHRADCRASCSPSYPLPRVPRLLCPVLPQRPGEGAEEEQDEEELTISAARTTFCSPPSPSSLRRQVERGGEAAEPPSHGAERGHATFSGREPEDLGAVLASATESL